MPSSHHKSKQGLNLLPFNCEPNANDDKINPNTSRPTQQRDSIFRKIYQIISSQKTASLNFDLETEITKIHVLDSKLLSSANCRYENVIISITWFINSNQCNVTSLTRLFISLSYYTIYFVCGWNITHRHVTINSLHKLLHYERCIIQQLSKRTIKLCYGISTSLLVTNTCQ